MRVCFVSLHYNSRLPAQPDELLAQLHLRRVLPAQMAKLGHEVHSIHAFCRNDRSRTQGVDHHFLQLHPVTGALQVVKKLREIDPEVVHIHGIKQRWNLLLLRQGVGARPSIVVHYHGGEPTTRPFGGPVERLFLSPADRFLMTTTQQCQSWQTALQRPAESFTLMPESSSPFSYQSRSAARIRTGISGSPVFLAAARLDPIKDPMTLIAGFDEIRQHLPNARLYWYFPNDSMIEELQAFLESRPGLAAAVELAGSREHADMQDVFNSADFFLQASLREYSSFALLDAMACGLVPVLSDIPSFRALAGGAASYFEPGDSTGLADRVLAIDLADLERLSNEVRNHFSERLSFEALARQLDQVYQELRSSVAVST